MKFLFSILCLLSINAFADNKGTVQFQNGNNIGIEELSGSVTYYCRTNHGQPYTRNWYCNDAIFTPGSHDYVVSTTPVDADKVTLTATREDGSTKSKTVSYDSKKSISKNRFNLLIDTVLQTPLLKVGANTVAYKFTKGKNTANEGTFTSKVTITDQRQCRHRTMYSTSPNDCDNQRLGCSTYFNMENNCKY